MDKLTQYQVDFLACLAKLEERDGEDRKIDLDENYAPEVIKEACKPYLKIINERKNLLLLCKKGRGKKKAEWWKQAVAERCKYDIIFWINYFAWIYNPWLTKYGLPYKLPFILTPKQQEYINWREKLYISNKSGVVFKCRDVGVSWCNMAHQAWHWQWEIGYQGRVGSLKAEEVDDKSDPDSLFEKLRAVIYNQPRWMRPKEFAEKDNKYDVKMKIINPVINSMVSGQMGDNMGRGGRSGLYDIDEWAKVQHARQVDSNLSANTYCRIYTGTPMGRDNDYAEKVQNALLPVFEFNYWDDPRKSDDWLQNFKELNSEPTVQQEVFKSFEAFKTGTYIPGEWVQASITLWRKIQAGDIKITTDDHRIAGMDVAAGGTNKTVLVWREGIVIKDTQEWDIKNTTVIAQKAALYCNDNYIEVLNYDPIAVGLGIKSEFEINKPSFRAIPVDVRSTPSEVPLDGDTKPARERCKNRRAELAERMRRRFECTFEFITQGINHPIEKMIAVPPDCGKLISQLSVPERHYDHGKFFIEPKEIMARRGEKSPDYFDACAFLEADEAAETHVVTAFNPLKKGLIAENEIPLNTLIESNQNYISIYHSKTLAAAIIGAIWDGARITVYNEAYSNVASVDHIVATLRSRFPPNPYEYVGNKEIFNSNEDDLFMQYMQAGILLQENFLYNELSATALLNEMFAEGRITIQKKCIMLLRQLDGFMRTRGMPDKTNMEVVMALCNLINRLKEFGRFEQVIAPVEHYKRSVSRYR